MIDMTNSMMYHIGNLNNQSERISYQMASGKAIDKGSDDAMLHYKLINLEDKLRVTEDLNLNITKTRALNDTADMNMGDTKDALDSIKIDLMKALNDGMDRSDKLALATNLKGIRENIIDRATTQVDGEYIFSGSVTTKETLLKDGDFDLNGNVEFNGDAFLREVAVQPGSYRDRGVTAYDMVFYNTDTALSGETLTFEQGDKLIDENGYEWKMNENKDKIQRYDHNGQLAIDSDGNILDEIDVTIPESKVVKVDLGMGTNTDAQGDYTISVTRKDTTNNVDIMTKYTYKNDGAGNYEVSKYLDDGINPPSVTVVIPSTATATHDAQTMHDAFEVAMELDDFVIGDLVDNDTFEVQYDDASEDIIVAVTESDYTYNMSASNEIEATEDNQSVFGTYSVAIPLTYEGMQLEAKHNYFDDMNRMINALEGYSTQLDGKKGPEVEDDIVDDIITDSLDSTSRQFDATNIGHGELGGRNAIFNIAQEKIEAQITHYNILIQEYGGADIAKLAMESKALELTYQSLYTTISKMNQLSLINFIK